jgi:hypothetical protein
LYTSIQYKGLIGFIFAVLKSAAANLYKQLYCFIRLNHFY